MKPSITAVIIAKNEEDMIGACLDTLDWCKQCIVLDDGSSDQTVQIAEKKGAQVIQFKHPSFARLRSEALKQVQTDWVLYIDADERVTPELAAEITAQIATSTATAITMRRKNYFYGVVLEHGGWERDFVTRAFQLGTLTGWIGEIHESPTFTGTVVQLTAPLLHFSHRDTASGLHKSASWTKIEARLLFDAGIPPVGVLTILRKGLMESIRRILVKKGYQDGTTGVIEGLVQGINRMLVYIQVWELQQKPSIPDRYSEAEQTIVASWQGKKV